MNTYEVIAPNLIYLYSDEAGDIFLARYNGRWVVTRDPDSLIGAAERMVDEFEAAEF